MGTHGKRSAGAGADAGAGLTCPGDKHPLQTASEFNWDGTPKLTRAQVLQEGPFETVLGPRFVLKARCLKCGKGFRVLSMHGLETLGHEGALRLLLTTGEAFS